RSARRTPREPVPAPKPRCLDLVRDLPGRLFCPGRRRATAPIRQRLKHTELKRVSGPSRLRLLSDEWVSTIDCPGDHRALEREANNVPEKSGSVRATNPEICSC